MSTGAGIDYSAWDHIYVSDDEDVTNPWAFLLGGQNTFCSCPPSTSIHYLISVLVLPSASPNWGRADRHLLEARLERMVEFQQRGEDLDNNVLECKRLLEEAQGRLKELEEGRNEGEEDEEREAELKKVQAEVKKLKKDEKSFEKMTEKLRREEKKLPWDVDTISKEGFSKSVLNIKPVTKEETEEEKVEKHKTFVEKYAKEIKHFDEKHALMEQVAHQAIVVQFILDLGRTLKVDARGCFRQFFSKIKTADKPYVDAFDHELELLKERIRSCAQIRMDSAMKELEGEERQKRLGPGGLDPVAVYESLPKEIQKSFDEKNIEMLQEAISKLDLEEGKYHLSRCIDSGLWVPESGEGDDEEDDEEEDS
ncbi:hsp90 co-chaperone Cdc37-like isoform X3 [Cottoperca gobio]|uniref:Hsp90 co-chaperone Cdc37 n=1 Tax=Cottoperca gobio TaxID=56716 RepID=A0A6J2PE81_COTGO|nr:hsp90 co-chaperone Cdc37-like isoform X3 [Cottoperca gobio]